MQFINSTETFTYFSSLQIGNEQAIFEHVDQEEYERRDDKRKNDDFIVDDDGFGYADKGGEIWDHDEAQDSKIGKNKKKKVAEKGAIDKYALPPAAIG